MFPFGAAIINRSTEYENPALLSRVRTSYGENVADVTEDTWYPAWSEKDLHNLIRRLNAFKKMLEETFHEHCDFDLYVLKHHFVDHVVEDIQKSGTRSVLDRSPYEHFNVQIKQAYGRISKRRRTKMMKMVSVMERSYQRVLSYRKKDGDGKLGLSDERRQ